MRLLILSLFLGLAGCAQAKCVEESQITANEGCVSNLECHYRTQSGVVMTGVPGLTTADRVCVRTDK